ncbi:50S ribosomal protein L21 [candidate division WOR-3 bacterium]|nr:50S ribosomal protein L21 [candidate division WOR-3 bacterium]
MKIQKKYAIVELNSGVQEIVSEGDIVKVPGFISESGKQLEFDRVLFLRDGDKIKYGEPVISGIKVIGEIMAHKKGNKTRVFKMKSKKNYRRTAGSREYFTEVKISKIG